jgi:hypothetical protein
VTTACIPSPDVTLVPAHSNQIASNTLCSLGVARQPTDPLFYATLILQNVVADSRYRVTRADNNDQLATGVAAGGDVVITSVPAYDNPMLVDIVVRKASASPLYKPVETSAYLYKTGGSSYVIQIRDD